MRSAADAGDKQHMRERGCAQSRASLLGCASSSSALLSESLLSIATASAAAAAVAADACIRCSDPAKSVLERHKFLLDKNASHTPIGRGSTQIAASRGVGCGPPASSFFDGDRHGDGHPRTLETSMATGSNG